MSLDWAYKIITSLGEPWLIPLLDVIEKYSVNTRKLNKAYISKPYRRFKVVALVSRRNTTNLKARQFQAHSSIYLGLICCEPIIRAVITLISFFLIYIKSSII